MEEISCRTALFLPYVLTTSVALPLHIPPSLPPSLPSHLNQNPFSTRQQTGGRLNGGKQPFRNPFATTHLF